MPHTKTKPKQANPSSLTLVSVTQAILVGEYRSFRRAAHALGVRQSAVSRAVRALEEVLGVALFERHQSGIRITNAGVAFLAQAREAIAQLESATKTAAAAGTGRVGQLRIGIQTSMATGHLRAFVELYRTQYPNVDLRFCEGTPVDHVAAVRRRQIDVALCTVSGRTSGLDVLPVWSERIAVVLPKGHGLSGLKQIAWRDLGDQRLIVRSLDRNPALCAEVRKEIETCGGRAIIEKLDVERDTLMQLVVMGFGVGLTSETAVAAPFPNIVFRPVAGNASTLQFNAVWLHENDNPALRRFLSLVRGIGQHPKRPNLMRPTWSTTGSSLSLGLAVLGELWRKLGLST